MQIERIELANLSSDPSNARKHDDKNIASIVSSLKRFGQQKPIVIDLSNVVRAGNGTLEAARSLGWSYIDCVRTDLKGSDAIAYAIADNRTAELAEWDDDVLSATLNGLLAEDPDLLNAAGFDEEELANMLGESFVDVTEDDVPEPPVDPITKPGDLWILGNHRLLCGDSTNAKDVSTLMNGESFLLMVTDPPYGVDYDANWRNEADRANGKPYGARAVGKVENDTRADWQDAWDLFNGDVCYVYHADIYSHIVAQSLERSKFEMRALIIWAKNNFAISRGHYHHKHEPCWYAVRKGKTAHWNGDHSQTTLWQIDKPMKSETGHSTQKPIECMARPIQNNSKEGDGIYEPFCGSGTTLIAAEQLNRKCYGMEISPQYCDVIVKRWENLTGRKAVLDDSRHEDDSESTPAKMADKARVPRRISKTSDKDNSRPEKQSARSDVSV